MRQSKPVRLLRKKMHLQDIIFSWSGIILILFLLGCWLTFSLMTYLAEFIAHFTLLTLLLDILVISHLIAKNMDATSKMTWLTLLFFLPILGSIFYCYVELSTRYRKLKYPVHHPKTAIDTTILDELYELDTQVYQTMKYVHSTGDYPVFQAEDIQYFSLGEKYFTHLLQDLQQAEKFILLEYFIIEEGLMWGKILDILIDKVKQGVCVKVMYDGTCEFSKLPHRYPKYLKKYGIECRVFYPLTPIVSTHYNYRDHRKIAVIDGKVAYTGGVNLADEYINVIQKHGHWKDVGIRLVGPIVTTFTKMFFDLYLQSGPMLDITPFFPVVEVHEQNGFVQAFTDQPLDDEKVSETVYMDLLYQAKKEVCIMSPYLILDEKMITALQTTAKKGILVKLIVPGIPDKKLVYGVAMTYVADLLRSGVQIYIYTPGFIHAKVFLSDQIKAVVGTINLDYRSLYHHFECGCYLYQTPCIEQIQKDFDETLKVCHPLTLQDMAKIPFYKRVFYQLIRLLAPMM